MSYGSPTGAPASSTLLLSRGDEWTVGTLLTVLRRRRVLLVRTLAVFLLLALAYCCTATRRYRATSQIQVQKEESGGFGLESSVMGHEDNEGSTDSLDYNTMLQTEVSILRSDALALVVLRELHLETTADYYPPRTPSAAGKLWSSLFFWRKPVEPLSVPLEQAPDRRYVVLKIFASHLKIEPVTGTRLISVSYSDPDPHRAADVVNSLVAELADFTFQQRFTATLQGSSWLTGQLSELRKQMEALEAKASELQRGTGMFGNDASRNVVLERLDSLNQTLAVAEQNRILKEAIDRVARSGNPELISSLSGNSSIGAVASMTNSLSLVQNLRQQEAAIRVELAEDSVRYGPAYPRLGELRAQLSGVDHSITEEVHRLGERAHTDYEIAVREEGGARSAFEEQKRVASRLNDTVLAYQVAKQEADSSRDMYESLLAKLKQTNVIEGLKANNITVVGVAQVPPPSHPRSPNIPAVLLAALGAGVFLGGALVVAVELTDNRIRSFEGLERSLGVPLIGVLPLMEKPADKSGLRSAKALRWLGSPTPDAAGAIVRPRSTLPALDAHATTFAEGLRALRTALLLARAGEPPQVILVTSCLEGEGKTTLALNLSALFAQQGARVLLVDTDLRRPRMHAAIGGTQVAGLGAALASGAEPVIRRPVDAMPNMGVICGDEVPPFPSELLGSDRMKRLLEEWRQEYDFVIFDSPPVLLVTDAVLLSQISDTTLLMARHGQTTRQSLMRSVEALRRQRAGHTPVCAVLNAVSSDSGDFYEYFGYQGEAYADQRAHA